MHLREQPEQVHRDPDLAELPLDNGTGQLREPEEIQEEAPVGHRPSIVDVSACTR
jgi:hypothetical protein